MPWNLVWSCLTTWLSCTLCCGVMSSFSGMFLPFRYSARPSIRSPPPLSIARSVRSHPGLGTHLHRVPRTAERRCVGEVEFAHGVDGHLVEDGGGRNVDALGHLGVFVPEELEAEEPAGPAVARVAHADAVAARVVRLVVVGLELDRHRIEAGGSRLVITQPGA